MTRLTPNQGSVAAWSGWLVVLVSLTVAMLLIRVRLDKAHVALAYLLVVLGASASGGRVLGLTIAGLAFLAFNFVFLPPYYTLIVADPFDWIVLFAFLVTCAVATQLLFRARSTADAAMRRAEEVDRLAALGAETLQASSTSEALQAIVSVIRDATGMDSCDVFRRDDRGDMVRVAHVERDGTALMADAAAPQDSLTGWLVERQRSAIVQADGTTRVANDEAGLASLQAVIAPARGEANREVRALLLPLIVRGQTVGMLRIGSSTGVVLSPAQARLLTALAYYAALGVERARLVESAERAESERRLEALRNALLTAVSHDLRTPLTTIKAIAHEVAQGADRARATIIESEVDRLDALIDDLLNLSRIQSGAVRPVLAVDTIDELIGTSLQQAAGALGSRVVQVDVPIDDVLPGRFDITLAGRVLVNLLENAAKYAPTDTPLEVRARRVDTRIVVSVLDRGPGVPESERTRIFEPFYRAPGTPSHVRGTGLGLSIARGLAEAQGGTVRHEPRTGGGSAFILELIAADVSL